MNTKSIKRQLKRTTRKALQLLPKNLRYAIFRSKLNLDFNPSKDLVVKLAETKEELLEQLNLPNLDDVKEKGSTHKI